MLLLSLVLAAGPVPFPVPSEKANQAVDSEATQWHVPRSLAQAERFYRTQLDGVPEVTFDKGQGAAAGTITIRYGAKDGLWTKAVLRGDDTSTTIQLTRVMVIKKETAISGNAPRPAFILVPRSDEVKRQLETIDQDHAPQH